MEWSDKGWSSLEMEKETHYTLIAGMSWVCEHNVAWYMYRLPIFLISCDNKCLLTVT